MSGRKTRKTRKNSLKHRSYSVKPPSKRLYGGGEENCIYSVGVRRSGSRQLKTLQENKPREKRTNTYQKKKKKRRKWIVSCTYVDLISFWKRSGTIHWRHRDWKSVELWINATDNDYSSRVLKLCNFNYCTSIWRFRKVERSCVIRPLHTVSVNDCYLGYMQLNFYIDMQRCCVSMRAYIDVRFVEINIYIYVWSFSFRLSRSMYFNRI